MLYIFYNFWNIRCTGLYYFIIFSNALVDFEKERDNFLKNSFKGKKIGSVSKSCLLFQLFKGAFYYCKGENARNITNKEECLTFKTNQWINQKYNFDDLGKALMSLFVLSSRDGWVNIMYTGLDAVGVDMQVSVLISSEKAQSLV